MGFPDSLIPVAQLVGFATTVATGAWWLSSKFGDIQTRISVMEAKMDTTLSLAFRSQTKRQPARMTAKKAAKQ